VDVRNPAAVVRLLAEVTVFAFELGKQAGRAEAASGSQP
jgi:hypothetical protein